MAIADVHFAPSAEPLRAFIPAYWDVTVEGDGCVEDLLRPEWTNIRIIRSGEWSFGPSLTHLEPLESDTVVHGVATKVQWVRGTAGSVFCIPVYPMGWHRLLGATASKYANAVRPLADILGSAGEELARAVRDADTLEARAAAADSFFLDRLRKSRRTDASKIIAAISLAISDPECRTVAELADRCGMTQATLARMTRTHFGFSPKRLMRRERFLRMLHSMQGMSVGEWPNFLDPQYTDQSHMIRDFQHFIGMAPTRYFSMDRPLLTAVFRSLSRLIAEGQSGDLTVQDGRHTLAFRPDTS